MFAWYLVLFASGMTSRPVSNPELFFWFLAMLLGLAVSALFHRPVVLRLDVPGRGVSGQHLAVL